MLISIEIFALVLLFCASIGRAFQPSPFAISKRPSSLVQSSLSAFSDGEEGTTTRREWFQNLASSSLAIGSVIALQPCSSANAEEPTKVLVLGGTGFVGSRVVKKLKEMGVEVVATSRDGRDGTVALDVATSGLDVSETVASLAKGCSAVISTIGAIGNGADVQKVNSATGLAASGAKTAGVNKFVYISVAPEVKAFAKDIDFFKPYMAGKAFSEDAVISNFGSNDSTLIEPTFIHGGDQFGINPPRVAGFYGEFIEALLSSGPIRAVTKITPDGFVKIALEPPVSVDYVANAAVAGALGKAPAVLDTYDKIRGAASLI